MQKTLPTSDGLEVTEIPVIGVSVRTAFESIFGGQRATQNKGPIQGGTQSPNRKVSSLPRT